MNQAQAVAQLRKALGSKFAYRLDPKAPTAEEREDIRAAWQAAKAVADEAVAARKARHEELMADPLYRELAAKAKAAQDAADKARSGLYRHRVTVGTVSSMFFSVKAEGDNWAEVVSKATGSAS